MSAAERIGHATQNEELVELLRRLDETQLRISEICGTEVDAVIAPAGNPYLLPHAQDRLRHDEQNQRQHAQQLAAILNALPAHIALLDGTGRIETTNDAWHKFAIANALPECDFCVGHNYIEICDSARGVYSEEAPAVAAGIRGVLRHEIDHFSIEYPCHSSAEQRWFLLTVTPLNGGPGAGAVVMHFDLTERKLAEEELRQREAMLRMASQMSRLGAWQVELPSLEMTWSDEVYDILDVPAGFVPSMETAASFYPAEKTGLINRAFADCASKGTPYDMELQLVSAKGRHVWVRTIGEVVRDSAGVIFRMQGAVQDISERKQAEQRFRELGEHIQEVFYDFAPMTKEMLYVSPAYETIWGRTCESLYKAPRSYLDSVHPDDRAHAASVAGVQMAGEVSDVEYRIVRPDGEVRWIHDTSTPVLNPKGDLERVVGTARDITRRKNDEIELKKNEELFRLVVKATNDAIWVWDLQANTLWWNEGYETLAGYSHSEVQPSPEIWHQHVHRDDLQRVISTKRQVIDNGGAQWSSEYRYRRKDGTYAYVLDRGHIIRNDQGVAVRMVGGMTDLTERRETETRLSDQAELINEASDAIILRDLDSRILFWNRGAERIYGWKSEEVVGKPAASILYSDPAPLLGATIAVLKNGDWNGELQQNTRSGHTVTISGRWTLLRDEQGRPKSILSINSDITEKKKMEQQFLRAQRMESVGTLAGGIAHDLNNILAPILMSTELLLDSVQDPDGRSILGTIRSSAERGADLVKQILGFARGVEGQHQLINPYDIALEVQKTVKETFARNIEFELVSPPDLWSIEADATQVHQVLMNLCVNARDAMPDGGKISVFLDNMAVDEVFSFIDVAYKPGPYVILRVEDTGEGMTKEVQEKIFEPFFTTKPLGKGTGLGLSTTFSIIRDHGGFINLYSEPGMGTKFKVYFPASTMDAEAAKHTPDTAHLPRGQGELILLVDDDASRPVQIGRVNEHRAGRRVLGIRKARSLSRAALDDNLKPHFYQACHTIRHHCHARFTGKLFSRNAKGREGGVFTGKRI